MPQSLRRDRVVLFRLTQEEYRLLQDACTAAGSRSVSEFTRTELLSNIRGEGLVPSRKPLFEIERKLDEVLQLIQGEAGNSR